MSQLVDFGKRLGLGAPPGAPAAPAPAPAVRALRAEFYHGGPPPPPHPPSY